MKKKLLLGLLVVLMVGILAFSVFACQPKDDGKDPDKKPDNKPTTTVTEVAVDAAPMMNGLINSINNTVKVVNDIEDAASVNAELYVNVKANGQTYNVKLGVSGSVDSENNANNWALVTANVLDTVQVGLFAEQTSNGKEYLYLGQNILNEEVVWSKLDQAENADLISGELIPALLELVAKLDENAFTGETFTDSASGDKANKKWDEGEAFVDEGDGKWSPAEIYIDKNNNGQFDNGEKYKDLNGNKKWDDAEEFTDANENGKWDEGEDFVDIGNGKYDAPSMFAEKNKDGSYKDVTIREGLEEGLLNNVELLGTVQSVVGLVGGLLFAPVDGISSVVDNASDLSSADGYAAKLNIAKLTDVIGGVMPFLGTMLNGVDLTQYQGIVDMVVPMLLGGQLDLTSLTFTPGADTPDIRLLVDINSDDTFGGLHLSYESADKATYVGFGLDNISFKAESASKPSDIVDEVADAEKLAINLGLDIELDAIQGGYANVDINVYPNASIGFDDDGYLALDLSKLYAEVVLTYGAPNWEHTEFTKTEQVIGQYNADKSEDIIIDLGAVASLFGTSASVYKIPVNLSEKYAGFITEQKILDGVIEQESEGTVAVSNKNEVDDIVGAVSGIIDGSNSDIIGTITGLLGKVGGLIEKVTALAEVIDVEEGSLDVATLMTKLLAKDGLIGGMSSTFPIFAGEDEITVADFIAPDALIGNIAKLIGVEESDIVGIVEDFTGATINPENVYDNMKVVASGFWQDGIGATVTATLGGDNATKDITIGLNANLIDNVEPKAIENEDDLYYDVKVEWGVFEDVAIDGDKFVTISNDTGIDGGKFLLDEIKGIYNMIVSNDDLDLGRLDRSANILTDNYSEVAGNSYAYAEDGYGLSLIVNAVEAPAGSIVNIYNYSNAVSVAPYVVDMTISPRPMPGTAVLFAENEDAISLTVEGDAGLMFYIVGAEGSIVEFGIKIEVAQPEEDEEEETVSSITMVNGANTTPAFVQGTSMSDPGIQSYLYTYTATEACTITLTFEGATALNKITMIGGQEMGSEMIDSGASYTLAAGETLYISASNGEWALDAVTFTVAGIPEAAAEEDFTLRAGTITTPDFVAGTSWDNPGITEYVYTYTATVATALTFTFGDDTMIAYNTESGSELMDSGFATILQAGETFTIAVMNANWGTEGVSFTVAIE